MRFGGPLLRQIKPGLSQLHKVETYRAACRPGRSGCEARPPRHTGPRPPLAPKFLNMEGDGMGAFVFTRPTTKLKVQHWLDDDNDALENEFQGVVCPACTKLHFINRKTGKLLGDKTK